MLPNDFTIVPKNYKNQDPRALLYLYPTTFNIVAFAKKLQQFSFYQTLEVAEDMAKKQKMILLPYSCIHWERAKQYGHDRKVKIGRKSFFLMKREELTKKEHQKLLDHIHEIQEMNRKM